MDRYKVYIKVDADNNITAVNSSAFADNTNGWIEVDQGEGDRYHHAQCNYFSKGLTDECGRYNYQYINGTVVEVAEADKQPIPEPIDEDEELAEAIEAATTIAGLKAALLGKSRSAMVKAKKL